LGLPPFVSHGRVTQRRIAFCPVVCIYFWIGFFLDIRFEEKLAPVISLNGNSKMLKQLKLILSMFLFAIVFFFSNDAKASTWKGAEGANWSDSANWNGGVPFYNQTISVDAVLDNGNTAILNQTGNSCRGLTMGVGTGKIGKLAMQGGSLTAYSTIELENGSLSINNNATLTANGNSVWLGTSSGVTASLSIAGGGQFVLKDTCQCILGSLSSPPSNCTATVDGGGLQSQMQSRLAKMSLRNWCR
jgi:hypothetical protein